MPTAKPDWDLLICATREDEANHEWFPAGKRRLMHEFLALEGMRFRNCYVTSRTIEHGNHVLFQILYRNAIITGGKVLHTGDFEGDL